MNSREKGYKIIGEDMTKHIIRSSSLHSILLEEIRCAKCRNVLGDGQNKCVCPTPDKITEVYFSSCMRTDCDNIMPNHKFNGIQILQCPCPHNNRYDYFVSLNMTDFNGSTFRSLDFSVTYNDLETQMKINESRLKVNKLLSMEDTTNRGYYAVSAVYSYIQRQEKHVIPSRSSDKLKTSPLESKMIYSTKIVEISKKETDLCHSSETHMFATLQDNVKGKMYEEKSQNQLQLLVLYIITQALGKGFGVEDIHAILKAIVDNPLELFKIQKESVKNIGLLPILQNNSNVAAYLDISQSQLQLLNSYMKQESDTRVDGVEDICAKLGITLDKHEQLSKVRGELNILYKPSNSRIGSSFYVSVLKSPFETKQSYIFKEIQRSSTEGNLVFQSLFESQGNQKDLEKLFSDMASHDLLVPSEKGESKRFSLILEQLLLILIAKYFDNTKYTDHIKRIHITSAATESDSETGIGKDNDIGENEKDTMKGRISKSESNMLFLSHLEKNNIAEENSRRNVVPLRNQQGFKHFTLVVNENPLQQLLELSLDSLNDGKRLKMQFRSFADFPFHRFNVWPLLDMNNVLYRLSTYANWPTSNISALRLAEAGFIYKGNGQIVECFSCGLSISEFIEGETPMNMHRRLAESCNFLKSSLNGLNSSNSNLTSRASSSPEETSATPTVASNPEVQNQKEHNKDHDLQNVNDICSRANVKKTSDKGSGFGSNESNGENRRTSRPKETLSTDSDDQAEGNNEVLDFGGATGSQFPPDTYSNVRPENITAHPSASATEFIATVDETNSAQRRTSDDIENSMRGTAKHPEFMDIKNRLESYRSWSFSDIQQPAVLVEAGFYFIGKEDIVRCFSCDIGLAEWDPNDDPWVEHARHSPECQYVKYKRGEEFIDNIQASWRQIYCPKHSQYEDYIARLNTFTNWRSDRPQRPEQLAVAGFFYTGEDDTVRCHYCDGGLRQWDDHDVPWIEHAKWFPFCKFVVKIKGLSFIEEVGQNYDEMYNTDNGGVQGNGTANRQNNGGQQSSAENNPTVKSALTSPAAQSVLEMGYTKATVNSAINTYIQQKGNREFKAEDILDIIFESEDGPSGQPVGQLATDLNLDRVLEDVRSLDLDSIDTERLRFMNEKLKSEIFLCKKCKSKERNMVFVPCGHRITCESCSKGMNVCLVCGGYIKRSVKTFMS